ncbi:uncharacterized protein LOC132200155 isoform X1 [Neocloeon triangulifer]|uniref:uncharacterized protein LOC132200155 isoform X1 n=1 Tax=Neocloeon triangulifer TaxID=2078957 RepID=UPI00286F9CBF|nr:uncharacterized protein LOC132200155 isoform X1 [Neocloeon triangulifer]
MRLLSWCFVAGLLLSCINLAQSYVIEVEHREKSTLTLSCVGEGNLKWVSEPKNLILEGIERNRIGEPVEGRSRFSINLQQEPRQSILEITNSKIDDTGIYKCFENDTLKETTHLYINDGKGEKLLVPYCLKHSCVLRIDEGSDFGLPCYVTKPDASIFLHTPNGEVKLFNKPKGAIVMHNANKTIHSGFWTCEAIYRNPSSKRVYLQGIAFNVFIQPRDTPRDSEVVIVKEGEEIKIGCSNIYNVDEHASCPLKVSHISPYLNGRIVEPANKERHSLSGSSSSFPLGITTYAGRKVALKISNITFADGGAYACGCQDGNYINAIKYFQVEVVPRD